MDGCPLSILTLDRSYSANLFNLFCDECGALYVATELLKKATSTATKEFREGPAVLGDGQGMSDDEEDEEDGVGSGDVDFHFYCTFSLEFYVRSLMRTEGGRKYVLSDGMKPKIVGRIPMRTELAKNRPYQSVHKVPKFGDFGSDIAQHKAGSCRDISRRIRQQVPLLMVNM